MLCMALGMMMGQAAPRESVGKSNYDGNIWAVVKPGEQEGYNQRQSLLNRGKQVYARYCIGCHGENGDGQGPAAERLITKPRDFTSGIYKFRSTDSSSLPMEADLHRTITRGLSRVSMPAFPLMPESDKTAVIQYIKSFYGEWDRESATRSLIFVPRAPLDLHDPERIARGQAVYLGVGCASCHGTDGQGEGATRIAYTDAWNHPQLPFNFTKGSLKGGDDPEDIYRTFHTGLRSIMPEFGAATMASLTRPTVAGAIASENLPQLEVWLDTFPTDMDAVDALRDEQREQLVQRNSWDLVAYVMSLRAPISPQVRFDARGSVPPQSLAKESSAHE